MQSCVAFGKHWDECAVVFAMDLLSIENKLISNISFGFLTHSLFLSLGVSRLSTMEFHFVPRRVASITTPPGCVGYFKPQFVVVIKFFRCSSTMVGPSQVHVGSFECSVLPPGLVS